MRRNVEYYKGPGHHFKYFSCGEYGDIFHRPHYHVILWSSTLNFSGSDEEYIKKSWQNGFIKIGTVTEGSINYVTGYVLKKQDIHKKWYYFGSTDYTYYENFEGRTDYFIPFMLQGEVEYIPPFNTQSLGIGSEWFEEHFETCLNDSGIWYKGHLCPIPRYFVRKYIYKDNNTHIQYNENVTMLQINILLDDLRECVRQKITPSELKDIRQENKIAKLKLRTERRFTGGTFAAA